MQWEDAADEEEWETAEAPVSVSGAAGSFDVDASADTGVSLSVCKSFVACIRVLLWRSMQNAIRSWALSLNLSFMHVLIQNCQSEPDMTFTVLHVIFLVHIHAPIVIVL